MTHPEDNCRERIVLKSYVLIISRFKILFLFYYKEIN